MTRTQWEFEGARTRWRRFGVILFAALAMLVACGGMAPVRAQSDGATHPAAADPPPYTPLPMRTVAPAIRPLGVPAPLAGPVSKLSGKPASLALAYAALDKSIGDWDEEHACATCHHTHSGLVANGLAGRKGMFDEQVIRRLAAHIDHDYSPSVYDYQKAGYTNSEAVWSSVSLGLWGRRNNDSGATAHAVAACQTALSRLPKEGEDWPWLSFGMAPWEDESSPKSGLALLGVGVGLLDKDLKGAASDAGKRTLEARLVEMMGQSNPLHLDLLLLWASSEWSGLAKSAPAEFRGRVLTRLEQAQQADGGWSLVGLGATNNPHCAGSDGYSTGLAILVMGQAGIAAADYAPLGRGRAWITDNQLEDGMWSTVSPTYDSSTERGREGDLTVMGSGFCAAALSAGAEQRR